MTHKQFIELNNGKFIEVAGSANALNQCVDLANGYLRDVLNHPIVEWTNAINFPEKLTDFEWIENAPTNIPQQGDLMIFFGQYGHISIFDEGDVNTFRSFDQNYPTNSPCHIQEHNYNNVFGWLRSTEGENMSEDMMQIEKKVFEELVTKSTKYDEFVAKGYKEYADVERLEIDKADLEEKVRELEFKLSNCIKEDDVKWVLNGKTEEEMIGTKKIIKNYAVNRSL